MTHFLLCERLQKLAVPEVLPYELHLGSDISQDVSGKQGRYSDSARLSTTQICVLE